MIDHWSFIIYCIIIIIGIIVIIHDKTKLSFWIQGPSEEVCRRYNLQLEVPSKEVCGSIGNISC